VTRKAMLTTRAMQTSRGFSAISQLLFCNSYHMSKHF